VRKKCAELNKKMEEVEQKPRKATCAPEEVVQADNKMN